MTPVTVDVAGSSFLIAGKCWSSFSITTLSSTDAQLPPSTPVTVIETKGVTNLNSAWLQKTVKDFLERDDVLNQGFITHLLFKTPSASEKPSIANDMQPLLHDWGSTAHLLQSEDVIPPGPYVFFPSRLCHVFRLLPDPQSAFMHGLVQNRDDPMSFQRIELGLIPVPSRLYYEPPSASLPMSGIRIAVKDVFDIRGTTTSGGCRAYEAYYGESESTAPAIQKLVDHGAVIVGKTKTVQFASGENPLDWIDYHCPFNPRGDGYFTASCSSSGSAAALAAYDWLDGSIGTDTFGSMLVPAAWQGLYGIRPTHGLLEQAGTVQLSSLFDTPGYFSRSIDDFQAFGNAWYGEQYSTIIAKSPSKIYYLPERFAPFPHEKVALMNSFVDSLVRFSDAQRLDLDVSDMWKKVTSGDNLESIDKFLETTLAHIQLYDCYHSNKKFRDDYRKAHGHEPYVDPMIRFKWRLGLQLTESDYEKAREEKARFMAFVRDHIVKTDSVLVLPMGKPQAQYRDDYLGYKEMTNSQITEKQLTGKKRSPEEIGRNLQGFGFGNNAFTVLAGLPAISVPVSQILIESKVTRGMIHEPISVMLVGPPGSDGWLIELIKGTLVASGRPLSVQTGKDVFESDP